MDIILTESGPKTHRLQVLLSGKTIVDKQIESSIDYQELSSLELSCARVMALGSDRSITIKSVGMATYNVTIDPINGFIYAGDERVIVRCGDVAGAADAEMPDTVGSEHVGDHAGPAARGDPAGAADRLRRRADRRGGGAAADAPGRRR